mmetsp:Transcript_4675/g.14110  ORF Transcript_4675/g.14110 Transcript_4675/m.14110 type:complete len:307 (+) Transcript_4675:259-1179(+)
MNTAKLSGSLAFAGLILVLSKSSMLRWDTMARYNTSLRQRTNSSATEFNIRSEKLLVASSQRQPTHNKYNVIVRRGMITNIVKPNFMLYVNRATTNSPSSSSQEWTMLSAVSVCKTRDLKEFFTLLSSAMHVNVQMYSTAEKNTGCESGMRHAPACSSAPIDWNRARSKCGPDGPPMPRRSSVGSVACTKVWFRYITVSNLSYTMRMSCTALAHTKRLTCIKQNTWSPRHMKSISRVDPRRARWLTTEPRLFDKRNTSRTKLQTAMPKVSGSSETVGHSVSNTSSGALSDSGSLSSSPTFLSGTGQ